jgi:hypothetical protein
MAFNVPTFNLTVNVFRAGNPPPGIPDLVSPCNLAFGRRVSSYQGVIAVPNEPVMSLLLPPGTDVRGPAAAAPDVAVEVPAGSGRYYTVLGLDDSGKGFPNEHRVAIIAWTSAFGNWPTPLP